MAKDLVKTLADLKEKEALKIVEDRLSAGEDPLKILDDARRALEIADRGYVMENSRIVSGGKSGKLLQTDHIKKAYLGL